MGKKAKRAMMAKAVALAASKRAAQEGNSGSAQNLNPPATAKGGKKAQLLEVKKRTKELRRSAKMQKRKDQKKRELKNMWESPPPSNLVGKLELPKPKYHSYFEFMENTERKEKKLEFQVTRTKQPFPGYKFVPVGDPIMTTKCKELSREQEAMIYIVSETTEQMSKISDHVHRIGYHFREYIVEEARAVVGETKISTASEPIPKSQEEINRQADAALRDLFPRIPHTDRQIILDHAFKLGNVFNGAPVVGLQADIPLSRRVQLAVLAHIRHTHTRYDLLLKETSWENARKVVEPICLDFIIKWRGDEETGRDQISEILREIVVITDSEDSSDDSVDDDYDDDSSDDDDVSSTGSDLIDVQDPLVPLDGTRRKYAGQPLGNELHQSLLQPSPYMSHVKSHKPHGSGNKAHRGFKRYQAAWDEAVSRRNQGSTIFDDPLNNPDSETNQIRLSTAHYTVPASSHSRYASPSYATQARYRNKSVPQGASQPSHLSHPKQRLSSAFLGREDVITNPPPSERRIYYSDVPLAHSSTAYFGREPKPPQVVRGSPSHGLKDMLVPSIETSSDGPSGRRGIQKDENSRRRMLSPPSSRQVIIIDDSPELKRRRVHDEIPRIVRHSEFPMSASVYSSDLTSQLRQRVPVYEIAPANDFPGVQSSQGDSRRYERIDPRVRDYESPSSMTDPFRHMDRQRTYPEPLRYTGSSAFSRTLARPDVLHHEYYEPQVEPTLFRDRDALISSPVNAYGNSVIYGTAHPRHENQSDRSFITLRRAHDPPLSPTEKPLYHTEESNDSIFYDHEGQVIRHRVIERPLPLRQRPLPATQPLLRPRQPVREVIVLD